MRCCDRCASRETVLPHRLGLFVRDDAAARTDRREWALVLPGREWDLCAACAEDLTTRVRQLQETFFQRRPPAAADKAEAELAATLGMGETVIGERPAKIAPAKRGRGKTRSQ